MPTAQLKQTSVGVSSPYGWRVLKKTGQRNLHKGTDFPFGKSTGVSAFGSGTVVFAGRGTGANAERGLYVQIKHADGIETSYHSLSKITVKVGQRVNMGDIIGYGGATAMGASGNHVHVGLWLNGSHVNLENYLVPGKIVTVSNTGQVLGNNMKPLDNKPAASPAAPTKPQEEDDMYDTNAQNVLTGHITNEINRLAGYVRRENRARWYKNAETGQMMVAKITDGYVRMISDQSQIDSLKANGYLLIASEEVPQMVDQLRWDNIIAEAQIQLDRIADAVAARLEK